MGRRCERLGQLVLPLRPSMVAESLAALLSRQQLSWVLPSSLTPMLWPGTSSYTPSAPTHRHPQELRHLDPLHLVLLHQADHRQDQEEAHLHLRRPLLPLLHHHQPHLLLSTSDGPGSRLRPGRCHLCQLGQLHHLDTLMPSTNQSSKLCKINR